MTGSANYGYGRGPTLYHVNINVSDAGDNVIVALAAGKKISVHEYLIMAAGEVDVSFESSGGTVLAGPMPCASRGGAMANYNEHGHFHTASGEALELHLGGAVQVGGHLSYSLIP